MATLKPYFYTSDSKEYSAGWPTSSSSAMYTGYAQWAMMPIFKNSSKNPIKIKSVNIKFGINSGSAKARLYFANLGSNIKSSTDFYECSNEFDVPKTTSLNVVNKELNIDVVVDAGKYFAIGFKADRTSGSGRLSVARTNTEDKAKNRPFYNGQSMKTGFGKLNIDRVPKSDIWSWQIPVITVEYETNKITPKLDKTSVTVKQGETEYVGVSGYDSWSIGQIEGLPKRAFSEQGNNIKIYLGAQDFENNISGTVEVKGLNSSTYLTVTIKPADAPNTPTATKNIIRPGESTTFSCKTAGAKFSIVNNLDKYINGSSLTYTAPYITELLYNNWPTSNEAKNDNISTAIKCYCYSPLNKYSKSNEISVAFNHYSSDDISINFPFSTALGATETNAVVLSYNDFTSVTGGSLLTSTNTNYADVDNINKLINVITNSNDAKLSFRARLINDWGITKDYTNAITIEERTEFRFITPNYYNSEENSPWVGLAYINKSNKLIFNPFCYPIEFSFGNDVDSGKDIYIKGKGNGGAISFTPIGVYSNEDNMIANINNSNLIELLNFNVEISPIHVKDYLKLPLTNNLKHNSFILSNSSSNFTPEIKSKQNNEIDITNKVDLCKNLYSIRGTIELYIEYTNEKGNLVSGNYSNSNYDKFKFKKDIIIYIAPFDIFYSNEIWANVTPSYESAPTTLQRLDIVGSHIALSIYRSYPEYSGSHSVVLEYGYNTVESINFMDEIVKSLDSNYNLGLNLESSQIISARDGDSISNDVDKYAITSRLKAINNLIRRINAHSSIRYINPSREEIAIGQPIMWDDSRAEFENKELYTASPWKELYKSIFNIHFKDDYSIWFDKNSNRALDEDSEYLVYVDSSGNTHKLIVTL